MYAAVDMLIDKLDRQVVKHKEKLTGQRHEGAGIKRDVPPPTCRSRRRAGAQRAARQRVTPAVGGGRPRSLRRAHPLAPPR